MTITLYVEDGLYQIEEIEDKGDYYNVLHTEGGSWFADDYELKEKLEKCGYYYVKDKKLVAVGKKV